MADVAKFDLTKGAGYDILDTTTEIVAAAAAMTIDYTASKRVLLYVKNADAAVDVYVTFKAPITNITGGIKREQGDYIVEVPLGDEAVFDLSETARYLNLTDKDIDVQFNDSEGTAVIAGVLSDITVFAINL